MTIRLSGSQPVLGINYCVGMESDGDLKNPPDLTLMTFESNDQGYTTFNVSCGLQGSIVGALHCQSTSKRTLSRIGIHDPNLVTMSDLDVQGAGLSEL